MSNYFNTVVKISADYETWIAQFINPNDLVFKEELGNTNDLVFSIPITDSQTSLLKEYKKVSFFVIDGVDDSLQWTGYISKLEFDTRNVTVTCTDEKGYMKFNKIYQARDYSAGFTVSQVLDDLVTAKNTIRGDSYFSYETNLTDLIGKKFDNGSTYYDILNELADLLDAEWTVFKGKIIFKDTIGIDRTSGEGLVELISDYLNPNTNNINFKIIYNGDKILNAITGIDGSGSPESQEDASSIAEFDRIEKILTFSEGDLVTQVSEYLAKSKLRQKEIEVFFTDQTFDFRNINLGDLVKVYINQNNDNLDTDETTTVIYKEVSFENQTANLKIKVSSINKEVDLPQNQMAQLFDDVKKLQLKNF